MKLKIWSVLILGYLSLTFGQDGNSQDSWFTNTATARAVARFAVETPLNNISANTVAMGRPFIESFQYILKTKGILGLYGGISMEVLRSGLWYPRMWLLQKGPQKAADLLGIKDQEALSTHLAAAGVTGLEAVTMPLYRLRTVLMVEKKEVIRQNLSKLMQTLYAGTGLRAVPTFLTWDAFLFAQAYTKKHMEKNSVKAFAFTTGTQIAMAGIMAPIYVVLINRQKLTDPCSLPFWKAIRFHYQAHGMPIFVRTAGLGSILLGAQAALTVGAIYLEDLL